MLINRKRGVTDNMREKKLDLVWLLWQEKRFLVGGKGNKFEFSQESPNIRLKKH